MQSRSNSLCVFVVETPHQLLNAIEAAERFAASERYLVLLEYPRLDRSVFVPLIRAGDWTEVVYVPQDLQASGFLAKLLLLMIGSTWASRYLRLKRRRRLDRIATRFANASILFLGHYDRQHKPYLHHLANRLRRARLVLLDDGTDTLEICRLRRRAGCSGGLQGNAETAPSRSPISRIHAGMRRRFWEWHVEEREHVTFFTNYQLDLKECDQAVCNDYRHLKRRFAEQEGVNEICFLGQCLVDDGIMTAATYISCLRQVKTYFARESLAYVPHPRESEEMITAARTALGAEIRRFGVPFELAIVLRGYRPSALASFHCSALENCRAILGSRLTIISFRIPPAVMLRWRDEAEAVYEYLSRRAGNNFKIVTLSLEA